MIGSLPCAHSGLDGTAEWAAGPSEGLSILGKVALFGIILAAIAVWVCVTRNRQARDEVGYEKTLA